MRDALAAAASPDQPATEPEPDEVSVDDPEERWELVAELTEQARAATPELSTPVVRRPRLPGVPGNLFVDDPEPIEPIEPPEPDHDHDHDH